MVGGDRTVFAGLIAMSRIGKKPIPIPKGVTVTVGPDAVEVQGPKGKLRQYIPPGVVFAQDDGSLVPRRRPMSPGLASSTAWHEAWWRTP